jgi:hypothetical protein
MRSGLAALLWLAVAFSLSVYGYRLWRRINRGPRTAASDTSSEPPVPPPARPAAPVPPPVVTPPAAKVPPRGERTPVAEMVTGIQMPCDLAPLLADGGLPDPFAVTFSTTTTGAEQVAAALDAELARLGFDVARFSDTKLIAGKDGRELTVTVVPDAAEVADGKRRRYPTALPGSVVVELRA